jgi:hypothetical protein
MPDADDAKPRLAFVHEADVPWQEVLAQRHGERRVSVHEKFLEWTPDRMVVLGRYDAGVVVERHGHASDHLVYVLDGELTIGDRRCPAGTLVVLEHGAVFGPLVAGERGALLFETWAGDPAPVPADKAGYQALLRERGIERLAPPTIIRPASAPGGRDRDPPTYG